MIFNFPKIALKLNSKKLENLFRCSSIKFCFLLPNSQSIRHSSGNDGDKINDEKFESNVASATKEKLGENREIENLKSNKDELNQKFIEIDFFGPKDLRVILPGNIGFFPEYYQKFKINNKKFNNEFSLIKNHTKNTNNITTTIERDLYDYESREDRQNKIISNVIYNLKNDQSLRKNSVYFKSLFFVKVYQSTQLLKEDIKNLFPEQFLFNNNFSIITVYKNPFCKKKNFIYEKEFCKLAFQIVEILNKYGYWANFIDPQNKRVIFGDISNVSCNSNKRFNNYGIQIEEFGQCKLSSHINGSSLFIGSIFTTAKSESTELRKILNLLTEL